MQAELVLLRIFSVQAPVWSFWSRKNEDAPSLFNWTSLVFTIVNLEVRSQEFFRRNRHKSMLRVREPQNTLLKKSFLKGSLVPNANMIKLLVILFAKDVICCKDRLADVRLDKLDQIKYKKLKKKKIIIVVLKKGLSLHPCTLLIRLLIQQEGRKTGFICHFKISIRCCTWFLMKMLQSVIQWYSCLCSTSNNLIRRRLAKVS